MSSLGMSPRGLLEIGKFALYVTVPIVATYCFATDSKTLHKLMAFVRSYPVSCFSPLFPLSPSFYLFVLDIWLIMSSKGIYGNSCL
ncbi:hypothetical protein B296_00009135 [Ensete ventricosum]|uniref:Uncharacterized protein n=1 Tax=Ensete ventricosum TaxID=4639 RepID=A0A427A4P7_ENSVE|nr:hypothetical protein B296_00009135 [Ensete ventricosum]